MNAAEQAAVRGIAAVPHTMTCRLGIGHAHPLDQPLSAWDLAQYSVPVPNHIHHDTDGSTLKTPDTQIARLYTQP